MKILFMGTPEFALSQLKALEKSHEIVGVVSQPDTMNKKGKLIPSVVSQYALEQGYPLYRFDHLRKEYEPLLSLDVDFIVTAAYGQIVPDALLALPHYYPINIHGSLLPKYRGAAPIQRSLEDGEHETGITFMVMGSGLDTGDMIKTYALPIEDNDTSDTLFTKLAILGAEHVNEVLASIADKTAVFTKQDDTLSTYAKMIKKEEEHLDFKNNKSDTLALKIRALWSNPGAYFIYNNQPVKVAFAKALDTPAKAEVGCVDNKTKQGLVVSCAEHTSLLITALRPAGKNTMDASAWLNGGGRLLNVGDELQ